MRFFHWIAKTSALAIILLSSPAWTMEEMRSGFDSTNMISLVHGPNWVDLDGDGRNDLVMKSRFSAPEPSPHSFSIYSFYLYTNEDIGIGNKDIRWYVVSVPEQGSPARKLEFTTQQGMTCTTRDIRLLVDPRKKFADRVRIVEGHRAVKESYADASPVTFTVYALEKSNSKAANEFAFIEIARFDARASYCSISEAFEKELNLPNPDPKSSPEIQLR